MGPVFREVFAHMVRVPNPSRISSDAGNTQKTRRAGPEQEPGVEMKAKGQDSRH